MDIQPDLKERAELKEGVPRALASNCALRNQIFPGVEVTARAVTRGMCHLNEGAVCESHKAIKTHLYPWKVKHVSLAQTHLPRIL